jgi:acyl carrier protein
MSNTQVMERVKQVTGKVLGVEPGEIKPSDSFIFDLGAESSQSVELVMAFEAEFNIDMDQEQASPPKPWTKPRRSSASTCSWTCCRPKNRPRTCAHRTDGRYHLTSGGTCNAPRVALPGYSRAGGVGPCPHSPAPNRIVFTRRRPGCPTAKLPYGLNAWIAPANRA